MDRHEIIEIVGKKYFKSNIENGEFSYPKAFKDASIDFQGIRTGDSEYQFLDLRFTDGKVTVLVETKQDFNKNLEVAKEQLSAYVQYERELTNNKIIAVLANTMNNKVMVWKGTISEENFLEDEYKLKTFEEYAEFYTTKTNDKEKIMRNTYDLNELLHGYGIKEKLRSQFVGTCLLTLKESKADLLSPEMNTDMIRAEMKRVLGDLLQGDVNRANKISLLDKKVLNAQDIRELDSKSFRHILKTINEKILPYINEKTTAGQDLLNLFFVTFNKYVGKEDKNQAFTPDHITEFMSRITEVNRNSKVLDPCCGSGSFLVRAMTQALSDCATEEEQISVKKNNIYGIELDENIFGLATTNMLIHGDGNSNIYQGSYFDYIKTIEDWNIDIVLMNPPYNATKNTMPSEFTRTWGKKTKQDPSKGLYFVKSVLQTIKKGRLAVLLPMACAIGSSSVIKELKNDILKENTLDAVFSLPDDIFYPGASAVACCMLFTIGKRHDSTKPTFFGYYKDDGFTKKKNLGRVEKVDENGNGAWQEVRDKWIELYENKKEVVGLSSLTCVTGNDEWLAEAYMETDYSKLTENDFQETINNYLAYLIKENNYGI